ncbi:MAG: NYN domain-containing protein [bacterium]|nr:NYN domain-containing protein [bacterium]
MVNKEQRVGIFIDVQNLYHSAKNLYKARVNFKELVRALTGGRKLIRAIAYVVKTEGTAAEAESKQARDGEAAFFDALKEAGIELRMKDIPDYPGGM